MTAAPVPAHTRIAFLVFHQRLESICAQYGFVVRRVLASLALLAACTAGCSDPTSDEPEAKPVRAADARCDSSESGRFYAENATYTDDTVPKIGAAKPASVGMDEALLEAATTEIGRSSAALSFLVLRDDKLVWEKYFNGAKPTDANNVHSLAKSLLSLVAGRAIADGHLSIDDKVGDYVDAPPHARNITVENLLTMSGGLKWEENVTEEEFDDDESYVDQVLDQPVTGDRGKVFAYSTGLTQVLSAVIAEATGSSTCAFAHAAVLDAIDVDVDHWLTDSDGHHAGGHSTFITPREIARIGQLVSNDGEKIVSKSWLRRSLAKKWDVGCRNPSQDASYGYLWWRSAINGVVTWEARGFGGQYLIVVPSLDLVVVLTNDTHTSHPDAVDGLDVLTHFVLPAAGRTVEPTDRCAAFDLHRVDVAGGREARLTDSVSLDMWGAPSPDGEKIAFQSRRDLNWEIYVMNADGSDVRRLTRDGAVDSFPQWSPDGKRILFGRDAGRRSGLYTMRPDGTDVRRLTRGKDLTPAWSPDGRSIAFHRAPPDDGDGTLWVVDSDGSQERRLEEGFLGVAPQWSPDGERIAFYARNGHEYVYTVDADGGDRRRIAEGRDPRWLPDDTLIFAMRGKDKDSTYRIVHHVKGRNVTIIDTPGDDMIPIPSADGRWLTFASASRHAPAGSGAAKMGG